MIYTKQLINKFLIFIVVLLLSVTITACGAKEEKMSILKKKPYFSLDVNLYGSRYILSINDVTVLEDMDGNQLQTEVPVNHLMRSGENVIELIVAPIEAGGEIGEGANHKAVLKVRDIDDPSGKNHVVSDLAYSGRLQKIGTPLAESRASGRLNSVKDFSPDDNGDVVVSEPEIDEIKKNIFKVTRAVNIPSNLPLWAFFNSDPIPYDDSMSDEDFDKFLDKFLLEYQKVYDALQTKNIAPVLPLFQERNREIDAAFYYPPGTMEEKLKNDLTNAANDTDAELVELGPEYTILNTFGNGKLANLTRESGKPAIVQNFIKAMGSRSYDLVFRYEKGKWILTR